MPMRYDEALRANVLRDEAGRVRAVTHVDSYPIPEGASARDAALAYLRALSGFELDSERLEGARQRLSFLDPKPLGEQFRLRDEKSMFDTVTIAFNQTYLNLPVWQSGVTVTLKQGPWRALAATDTTEQGIDAELPSAEAVERFRRLFASAEKPDAPGGRRPRQGVAAPGEPDSGFLESLVGAGASRRAGAADGERDSPSLIRGRFYVFRYDPEIRLGPVPPRRPEQGDGAAAAAHAHTNNLCRPPPPYPFPIPPVNDQVGERTWRVVAELVYRLAAEGHRMNWRALVDVESGDMLYLRALASHVNGHVFLSDPITKSGDPANTPAQVASMDGLRDVVTLDNLDGSYNPQELIGTRVALADITAPSPVLPAQNTDFDFPVRSDDFSAVNAYYHTERFFQLVEDLGFPLSTYFDGTTFPVEVDPRGLGSIVNAWCIGDPDGIDYTEYALAASTGVTNPAPEIGIATDWRVVLHELGGHGILYDHVEDANFGNYRVHSMGDSFAMVLNDYNSAWHSGFAIDRFLFLPFIPEIVRRSDRDVASGWGWGGAMDGGGYESEEILSTCIFRFYRSIGGDSGSLTRREFCARATCYLMLRAVSTLTPISNPTTPEGILAALIAADAGDWTSEGLAGGAYNKVLTWAFEEQDLGGGVPPAIDVYIDDGRAGEYPYQAVHWNNGSMWNRRSLDGLFGHEEPELGSTNYAYCYVKNCGTSDAADVVVNAYHCKPSAGVTWPIDFDPMTTASIAVGAVAGNNAATVQVGPFHWTPTTNAFGHDCMLMIATATGDPSNVDLLSLGETYADWRLVPNDNNVGQRNVNPVAAGDGLTGMVKSLDGKGFWIGNPDRREAILDVSLQLPPLLERAGWRIVVENLPDGGFRAKPGERRLVTFSVHPGTEIPPSETARTEERDIVVTATANGAPIGGMTYRLDPDLEYPHNDRRREETGVPAEPAPEPAPERPAFPWWLLLLILLLLLIIAYLLLR